MKPVTLIHKGTLVFPGKAWGARTSVLARARQKGFRSQGRSHSHEPFLENAEVTIGVSEALQRRIVAQPYHATQGLGNDG